MTSSGLSWPDPQHNDAPTECKLCAVPLGPLRHARRGRTRSRPHVHRRHLQSGQAAACHVKREQMQSELAKAVGEIRKDAKRREKAGKADPTQIVEQGSRNDRATDAHRAKLAGTNRQYINDADTLAGHETAAEGLTQAERVLRRDWPGGGPRGTARVYHTLSAAFPS